MSKSFRQQVLAHCLTIMASRKPDFAIGEADALCMLRWRLLPKNALFNIYLHRFLRSDEPRALHDHPYVNVSWVLSGGYYEYLPSIYHPDMFKRIWRRPGSMVFRQATTPHRIELAVGLCPVSLFFVGPRIREWGFHCPQGWKRWQDFVKATPGGNAAGPGCGD